MYYKKLKFCIIYLEAILRGYFEAILMKNTLGPLGVNDHLCKEIQAQQCSRLAIEGRSIYMS
jgi:hypothetical protein